MRTAKARKVNEEQVAKAAVEGAKRAGDANKRQTEASKKLMKEWASEGSADAKKMAAAIGAITKESKGAGNAFDQSMRLFEASGKRAERGIERAHPKETPAEGRKPGPSGGPSKRAPLRPQHGGGRGGHAMGIVGDIAQGAGVDLNLGAHVARNMRSRAPPCRSLMRPTCLARKARRASGKIRGC